MWPWLKSKLMDRFGKTESAYYKKIKKLLRDINIPKHFSAIYFLGGFEYSEGNYAKYKQLKTSNELSDFIDQIPYNVTSNNIELYLIEYPNGEENYLITLLDPYELFSAEEVLNYSIQKDIRKEDFKYELIYP